MSRAEIRTDIRNKRRALSKHQQQKAADDLLSQLCSHPKVQAAQHLAIYISNDGELNTFAFIQWCWQQGKQVYLPVIHPFSPGHLLFLHYLPDTEMVKNKYNILEPKLDVRQVCPVNSLDIIFTPLVAFTKSGDRLGMGGGFYDRTLASWYQQVTRSTLAKPYPIGLAHNCQQVDHIPCEYWDIPLPEIITPSQHFTVHLT